jgi:beta-lactamase class A
VTRRLLPVLLALCGLATFSEAAAQTPGLEARLRARLDSLQAVTSVYAKHLPSGSEVAVRADQPMNTLSVIKIPVMVLAFRDAEAGRLDLEERYRVRDEDIRGGSGILRTFVPGLEPTYRDLITQMIITSDNTATDIAIAKVGGVAAVNAWLTQHGYAEGMRLTQTTGELFTKYGALPQPASRSEKTNADRAYWLGEMTPRATGRMLEALQRHTLASQKASEEMVRVMRAQQAGVRRLPHFVEVPIAHKTGDFPPVLANDVGIAFARSGPIVISFFTNEITGPYGEAEDRIGRAAQLIVQYFDGR